MLPEAYFRKEDEDEEEERKKNIILKYIKRKLEQIRIQTAKISD